MNVSFAQEARLGKLHTELGPDVLVLLRFSGADFVNGLFDYRVDALSTDPSIDLALLIGTHATVEFRTQHGARFFDGIVVTASNAGTEEGGNRYELVLRPWFALASRRRNQRIFHEKSPIEIVKEVMEAYAGLGAPHLDDSKLTGDYPTLEYTVQYRETDLAFCTRIMQQFAVSYYFRHEEGSHTMVLSDDSENHEELPGGAREFRPAQGDYVADEEHFWEWKPVRNLTTGVVRLTGFNFKTPDAAMEVEMYGDAEYAMGDIESFDYAGPSAYLDEGEGKGVVAKRMQQERIRDNRHRAVGDVLSLSSGQLVELTGDDLPRLSTKRFVCMRATHNFTTQGYGSGGRGAGEQAYSGTYEFIPDNVPLVPENTAPQPVVHGVQTATVVGDGEIDCDEHGRILVKFHWDLNGAHSMRCRVSQNWAHKGYGSMIIPRIGMEVIVEFVEGDPSLPIVTGCVFNGKNTPPYALPANKTRSVWKTNSHEADGFNEVRFEDKGGEEEIWIHAQKDRNEKTLNNHTEEIDVDWSQKVGNDKSIEVGHDHSEKIGNDETRETGHDQTVKVGNNHTENIGKDRTDVVGKNQTEKVGENNKTTIGKDHTHSTGKNAKISVGENETRAIGKNSNETVGDNKTIKVGKNLTITAGDSITITVGKASITMKKDGTFSLNGEKMQISGDTMKMETKKGTTIKAKNFNTKTSSKSAMKASKINLN